MRKCLCRTVRKLKIIGIEGNLKSNTMRPDGSIDIFGVFNE